MFKKYKLIYIILLLLIIVSIFRYNSNSSEYTINHSIKNILSQEDNKYNFLEDKDYIYHMDLLVKDLTKDKNFNKQHYCLGLLDDDNIPELIIFRERDPEDKNDTGFLELYMYNGHKYVLTDKLDMNYDNTNYEMKIGYISPNQRGLYINNQVGAHSGMTYGFILKNKKLSSILNPNKINLISTYTDNKIQDINNDGILEFSVYTNDPESKYEDIEKSDKLILWYQWDGIDSAKLIKIEKENNPIKEEDNILDQDNSIKDEANHILEYKLEDFNKFISNNSDFLDKENSTNCIKDYLDALDRQAEDKSLSLNKLIEDEEIDISKINLKEMNDLQFLQTSSLFLESANFQKELIKNYNLGYYLDFDKDTNTFYYDINYPSIKKTYKDLISQEYSDYLNILSSKLASDLSHTDKIDQLAETLAKIENFKTIYPYSDLLDKLNDLYKDNLYHLIYGNSDRLNYEETSHIFHKDIYTKLLKVIDQYPDNEFSLVLKDFIKDLEENDFKTNLTFKYKNTNA